LNILLTGATGFIGKRLSQKLISHEHQVVAWVRNKNKAKAVLDQKITCVERLEELKEPQFDVIINLAGEPIADKRWTAARKLTLRSSRIDLTEKLIKYIKSLNKKPKVILSGSAIGYYGSQRPDLELDENSDSIDGFTHTLCADWETAAASLADDTTRVCLLRTGIVLGKGGGVLGKMLLPFKLGLGGPIGNGQQIMSWIHLQDWIKAALFLIENEDLSGPFNLVSPNPVSNKEFTSALAKTVHRPAIFRVPCAFLKLVMGESAELLCEGQRVIPKRLLDAGFKFDFDLLEPALNNVVAKEFST